MLARLRILLVLVAMLALQLVATSDAHAYSAAGRPWPHGTITYWSTLNPSYAWSTNVAIRAWNNSGARVRFVRASSRRRAQLVIRTTFPPGVPHEGGAGQAQLGYWPGRQSYVVIGSTRTLKMGDWDEMARLMAHELGHVTGLNHSDPSPPACTIMKTYLNPCQTASPPRLGYWYCRMLFRDDIAGVIRLYGRRRPAPRTPSYCPILPAPKQLTNVSITGGESSSAVTIAWTNPGLRTTDRILVEEHDVACADVTERTRADYWQLKATATSFIDAKAPERGAGPHCYTLQAINYFELAAPRLKLAREFTLAPPVVGTMSENPSELVDYTVAVTMPPSADLTVRRTASGACAASAADGEYVSSMQNVSDGTWSLWDIPTGSWCLSFFATNGAAETGNLRSSAAVTREITHATH